MYPSRQLARYYVGIMEKAIGKPAVRNLKPVQTGGLIADK
jgi:hypothetical protein